MAVCLIYVFIVLSQFGLEHIFGQGAMFGGYPILTWMLYALYLLSIVYTLLYITRSGTVYRNRMYFFVYMCVLAITYVYSVGNGASFMKILSASVYYVLPLLLFPALVCIGPDRIKMIKLICLTCMLGGAISVLFMLGLLAGHISADVIDMSRTSTIVDGGLGLVAVALALYMIFYRDKDFNVFYKYATLVSGLLIVMGGQSRARIITLALVVVLSVLINIMFSRKNRMIVARVVVFLAIILLMATHFFPQILDIAGEITGRFDTIGTDSSSVYRVYEKEAQMEAFYKEPVIGCGWDGLRDVKVVDLWGNYNHINNHNMYSSILAYGGIMYALPFFMWFIMLLFGELRKIASDDTAKLHVIFLVILAILSWSSAGFVKFSQTLSIIIIYLDIIDREQIPCPIKKRKVQKFTIKFQ